MKLIPKAPILLLLFFCPLSLAKLLIITHSYNRPDFIEIQYQTFKKFMLDDYEFIVFNDARDPNLRKQIQQMCAKHQLSCIEIAQEVHDRPYLQRGQYDDYNHSAARCANVVQYSLDLIGFDYNGIVAIIDSDMFLVKEFSIEKYLEGYDIAALPQCRGERSEINYIWNGLVFFNMQTLPNKRSINFNCGWVNGVATDVGGHMHYYLQQNPQVRVKYFESLVYLKDLWCKQCCQNNQTTCAHSMNIMKELEFSDPLINLAKQSKESIMEVFLGNTFLHYRAGGNWNNESAEYHERKTKLLTTCIDELIKPEFFSTGQLCDLVPIDKRIHANVGKITVLTQPIHHGASQQIQGHSAVTSSVLRGLKKLKLPMNYNPDKLEEVGEHIFVLVNINALQQAIELKRQGRIKTLIVGPNILNNPSEYDHILGSPEIDWYIAPCNWARDCNCQEEPRIANKTAIWYAGVDTDFWQPQQEKHETKTMLVYWKTEPEEFCVEIETMLHTYGWKTIRVRYGSYNQEQYKEILQRVDAVAFVSVSESQGIALAECWAMNVPTLVWNPGTAFIYNRYLPVSSAPYLTSETGCMWQTVAEFEVLINNFEHMRNQFSPRQWVTEYMTDESSIYLLLDIIKNCF